MRLFPGLEVLTMNGFCLQSMEKALSHCIIPTIPLAAHATYKTIVAEKLLITIRDVLAPLITMNQQACQRSTLPQRHFQASVAVILSFIDQHTTAPEHTSMKTDRYSQASRVGT